MINEARVVELVVEKIWQVVQSKCDCPYQENLIPYAHVYEAMGRRGFRKQEARMLGHFFESRGLIKIAKRGWIVTPTENKQLN